jgi:DNA-binding MarR family transcriptional regulator
MVVKSRPAGEAPVDPAVLDLGYVALFVGLRINELVVAHMAAEGFGDVRESHGYLIQHLIEQERSITELADRMEVTQQAASKAVAELLRLGVLEATDAADRRTKRIRLSARGWRSVKLARQKRRQIEKRLVKAVGASKYEEGKKILLRCLGELGGIERIRSRQIRQPS